MFFFFCFGSEFVQASSVLQIDGKVIAELLANDAECLISCRLRSCPWCTEQHLRSGKEAAWFCVGLNQAGEVC